MAGGTINDNYFIYRPHKAKKMNLYNCSFEKKHGTNNFEGL